MVVNRRATAIREVEITFQGYANAEHRIKDMFTGIDTIFSKSDVGSDGRFVYNTQIDSGAAKLLLLDKAPAAPQNLVITNAGHNGQHPILHWDANSEPDLSHYQIYRGDQDPETGQVNWSAIATTSTTTWTDPDITINTASQTTIFYRVTAMDTASLESDDSNQVWTNGNYVPKVSQTYASKDLLALPQKFTLLPNYPNPFNPETAIRYGLPAAANVQLVILNVLGQPVRTLVSSNQSAGWYALKWDGRDGTGQPVASGIYLYRIQVRSNDGGQAFISMAKMLLAR